MTGWYYLPFEEKPETSDWWKMDHTKRAQLHGPDMIFDVEVTEAENGIDVHIVNTGIDRAPLRVELAFDAGCRVETEQFCRGWRGGRRYRRQIRNADGLQGKVCHRGGPVLRRARLHSG